MTEAIMAEALSLIAAGVGVIPVRADGTKRPTGAWKEFESRLMTPGEVHQRFAVTDVGLAVVAGTVSGTLEVLDFDDPAIYDPWRRLVDHLAPGLVDRLPEALTPSGGRHIYYRHDGASEPRWILAQEMRPDDKGKLTPYTLIETRAEGNYAIVPPSPAACHPDHKPYTMVRGRIAAVPTITTDEREVLLTAAHSLTRHVVDAPSTERHPTPPAAPRRLPDTGEKRPGDEFNEVVNWSAILEPHGWVLNRTSGDEGYWRRPGKDERGSQSATTDFKGSDLLKCFSSNASPFEQDKTYSKFAAYALLEHGGDFGNAGRDLRQRGFGNQPPTSEARQQDRTTEQTTAPVSNAKPEQPVSLPWESPVPLDTIPLPHPPLEVLAPWLGNFCRDLARALQVPEDLVMAMTLAVVATTAARRVVVEVKRRYQEPTNIWTFAPLPSGSGKTAVVLAVTKPLVEWEVEQKSRMEADIAAAGSAYRIKASMLKKTEDAAARATDNNENLLAQAAAADLARELATMEVPKEPQLLAGDVTPEALPLVLMEQGGRIGMILDEGGVFDTMAGRYSNNVPSLDNYLNAHSGGPIRVQRRSRPAEFIERPALTLAVSPQPDVLRSLSKKPGFRGRGLLARFLYTMPKSILGQRDIRQGPIDEDIEQDYHTGIRALLDMPWDANDTTPYVLTLTPDAYEMWMRFKEWIEPRLQQFESLGAVTDWGSKLPGAVARLAGLLHLALHARTGAWQQTSITRDTMDAAITLGRYFIPHALASFQEMHFDERREHALYILAWIQRHDHTEFTRRDVWLNARKHRLFPDPSSLDAPLAYLCDRNYLRVKAVTEQDKKKPGPRAVVYDVNPGPWPTSDQDDSGDSVYFVYQTVTTQSDSLLSGDLSLLEKERKENPLKGFGTQNTHNPPAEDILTALETALWLRELRIPFASQGGRLKVKRGIVPPWLMANCTAHNDEVVALHAQHLQAQFAGIARLLSSHLADPALAAAATTPPDIVARYLKAFSEDKDTGKARRRLSRGHGPAGHDVVAAALLHALGALVRQLEAIERPGEAFVAAAEATVMAVAMGWASKWPCPLLVAS